MNNMERKYVFDERKFERVDCEERAYWIGYLIADGWINKRKTQIGLCSIDEEVIFKFRTFIGNKQIPIIKRKNCAGIMNQNLILINSVKMVTDLANFGMVHNKSHRIGILNIPEFLLSHFIRGYFDGDGCFYSGKEFQQNQMTITSCSLKILEQIKSILQKNSIESNINASKRGNYFQLRIGKKKEIAKFGDFIYNNSTIYLERKYNKYKLICENVGYKKNKNSTSKYYGVTHRTNKKISKAYESSLHHNGKHEWLGAFVTEIEAAKTYNTRAIELNFPPEKLNKFEIIAF